MNGEKPITPEFVRGWRAAADFLDAAHDMYMSADARHLREFVQTIDPLAAAKERLGRFLVGSCARRWFSETVTDHGVTRWRCMVFSGFDGFEHWSPLCASRAEAIMAALDAAGAEK